ncbi:amidohydrolase [Rhizocola hellebori]|uniref:Amidohydrolase n=2 Tax=Rhizocola hellebori TaxID=1392758 RepID=A0A8J3QF57_9ACTN|nr:amidohydrolase [Rhizocola hellebori]
MWLAAAASSATMGGSKPLRNDDLLVLAGATVIDGTGSPPRPDTTIVVAGDRLAWIGHHSQMPPAEVVDVRGKFIIPGLWDMHTHDGLNDRITLALHIANGVTSVREMWGMPQTHAVRQRIERGQLLGPRFTIASNLIDGAQSVWAPRATEAVSAADGRAAVRAAKLANADFIKVYSYLGQEAFYALADEAGRLGLPFAGHQPIRLPVRDVVTAGMRSFEHLFSMPTATSVHETRILQRLNDYHSSRANPGGLFDLMYEAEVEASLAHDPSKAAALYDLMAHKNCWQTPTLTVRRVSSVPADMLRDDPRLKYIDNATRQWWTASLNRAAPPPAFTRFRMDMVAAMERAGVGILGGTDAPNPFVFPGFAAHDELELLVQAGLSPARALRTMTADAARFQGLQTTMGTVETNKVADLLVLDANPLTDIRNTQRIHAIVTRGKLITAQQRAKILAQVQEAANAPAGHALGTACRCQ